MGFFVMMTGSLIWLLWSHIVFYQWCNQKREGQDLYQTHSSSDWDRGEGADEGLIISD